MAILVKIHRSPDGKRLFAICDKDLLGKKFVDGKLQLDLSGQFSNGEIVSEEKLRTQLKGTYFLNIVGKQAIALFIRLGLIGNNQTITIVGIPHAEVVIGE